MGLVRNVKRAVKKAVKVAGTANRMLPGTGRHAAKRAEQAASNYAAEAEKQKLDNERKTARERRRSQKLAVRGIRSKRAAALTNPIGGGEGNATIG